MSANEHTSPDGLKGEIGSSTRIVLRPIASPLPLAFFAFGAGSMIQSASQLGLIPQAETRALALVFGTFVFPLQALAALLAFYARETLGATATGLISVKREAQWASLQPAAPAIIGR